MLNAPDTGFDFLNRQLIKVGYGDSMLGLPFWREML